MRTHVQYKHERPKGSRERTDNGGRFRDTKHASDHARSPEAERHQADRLDTPEAPTELAAYLPAHLIIVQKGWYGAFIHELDILH
jgi:hypothetical protein